MEEEPQSFDDIIRVIEKSDVDDTTDSRKRKSNKAIYFLMFAVSLLVISLVTYFTVNSFLSKNNELTKKEHVIKAEEKPKEKVGAQKLNDLPSVSEKLDAAPPVESRKITVTESDKKLVSSSSFYLSNPDFQLLGQKQECSVEQPGDTCLADSFTDKDKNIKYTVFFLNDGARHPVLREATLGAELPNTLDNALFSATVTLKGEQKESLLIVNNDSSGWIITPKGDAPIQEFIKNVTTR